MHKEFIRINPDADTAVLFIHGICGTPDHFRELIPLQQLVPDSWSVYNLLLDGHGGTVMDFAGSSGKIWREQVTSACDTLMKSHERILIAGHSMGTLYALQLASKYPSKVQKLFLLAVPMRPWLNPVTMIDLLMMVFGKLEDISPKRKALMKAAGIQTSMRLWEYVLWVPRFVDLFREIYRTERIIGSVEADCRCYQSQKDELVLRASEKVLRKNRKMQIYPLKGSSHFYYCPEDREQILRDFRNWTEEKSHD